MKRIIDGRDTGKTRQLMLIAKDEDALFVCLHPYTMQQKASAYNIDGIEFISYYDFLQDKTRRKKYVIDELDECIKYLGGNDLIGYTLTLENE